MNRLLVSLVIVLAILNAAPPGHWRKADVVTVHSGWFFRYFEIIDSFDPSCRLTYREVRSPFKPLSLKGGTTAQITGWDRHIYLMDDRGRVHKGTLMVQDLMPPPPAPPHTPLKQP